VEPSARKAGVATVENVCDRDRVDDDEPGDGFRVIKRHSERHVTPAIVPCNGEPLVAEDAHQVDAVIGHGSLRVRRMVVGRRGLGRLSIPPEIRANDSVALRELRRNAMPRDMRPRMAVEQQHG
jgi:hypothetical protein